MPIRPTRSDARYDSPGHPRPLDATPDRTCRVLGGDLGWESSEMRGVRDEDLAVRAIGPRVSACAEGDGGDGKRTVPHSTADSVHLLRAGTSGADGCGNSLGRSTARDWVGLWGYICGMYAELESAVVAGGRGRGVWVLLDELESRARREGCPCCGWRRGVASRAAKLASRRATSAWPLSRNFFFTPPKTAECVMEKRWTAEFTGVFFQQQRRELRRHHRRRVLKR